MNEERHIKKNIRRIIVSLVALLIVSAVVVLIIVNVKRAKDPSKNHGKTGYIIEDGMTMPILQFSNFRDTEYENKDSDILRFCVYVETDYDTDNDGKADLVKVFAQVPTQAVLGKYKAAAIYDPTPYNTGVVENFDYKLEEYSDQYFDYNTLYKDCEKRDSAEIISTYDHALSQSPGEWNYVVPATGNVGYNYADLYDYYLVRGYAVIESGGIGTLGSEGFELCGFDLEAYAHGCVVEWLAGNRKAYSDKDGTSEVAADWCNGKVAMTGCSYGGTLPFEVATLGVDGLETIIPFAGIASWYNYTNSQGVTLSNEGRYIDTLASFNGGGLFLDDSWTVLNREYASWLWQMTKDQNDANGNYTDIWEISNYADDYEKIKCPALIVHGLNDFNVTSIQADYMYKAFKKAGQPVKLVLHQDGHNFLNGIMVGDELWQNIMNKWLSHYLLGVDNHIEDMAEVTYQSNVDGQFYTSEHWRDFDYEQVDTSAKSGKKTISSEGLQETTNAYLAFCGYDGLEERIDTSIRSEYYISLPKNQAAAYTLDLAEGKTVYGVPEIHFKASPSVSGYSGLMATAVLVDVIDGEKDFPSYMTKSVLHDTLPIKTEDYFDIGGDSGYGSIKEYVKSYTRARAISYGWLDLANPNGTTDWNDYKEDTRIEEGKQYEYTFYMLPTIYELEPGHHLELILTTYDGMRASLTDGDQYVDYGYTIDNATMNIEIPLLTEVE